MCGWVFLRGEGLLSSIYRASVRPYIKAKKLHLITDGDSPFRGVRFRQTRGHSPGHMSIELGVRRPRVVAVGDVWMISVRFFFLFLFLFFYSLIS